MNYNWHKTYSGIFVANISNKNAHATRALYNPEEKLLTIGQEKAYADTLELAEIILADLGWSDLDSKITPSCANNVPESPSAGILLAMQGLLVSRGYSTIHAYNKAVDSFVFVSEEVKSEVKRRIDLPQNIR